MSFPEVFVVSAARTAIGRFGGALRTVSPAELGAIATRAALDRAAVAAEAIDLAIFGHARQAGSGPNPARQVASRAGLPYAVPAWTMNQACASGLQAIAAAAQSLVVGEGSIAVAGGIESMSRVPFLVDADHARWGHRMGDFPLVDAMYRDGLQCSVCGLVMGQTADLLAHEYGITREASDAYALESQRRASAALAAGRFTTEIVPVQVPADAGRGTGPRAFERDEHPRGGTTLDGLRRLPPLFGDVDGVPGVVTAGTASGLADGGAAVVLATGTVVRERSLRPLARIVGWATAGVDPRRMGIGPVPAVRRLLRQAGLGRTAFDLVELNEAFAAQVLAVQADLAFPTERLNVNGGAIALGHPIGCTGTRIVVTLLHELRRRGASLGLATLCVSGGLGMAMAFEHA